MRRIIIQENQRGLLFRRGKLKRALMPGGHWEIFGGRIEVVSATGPVASERCPISVLLADKDVEALVAHTEVADNCLKFHYVNGRFHCALRSGVHAFWKVKGETHEFRDTVDISTPDMPANVTPYMRSKMQGLVVSAEVPIGRKGTLYFDKVKQRELEPGIYHFWKTNVKVEVVLDEAKASK